MTFTCYQYSTQAHPDEHAARLQETIVKVERDIEQEKYRVFLQGR